MRLIDIFEVTTSGSVGAADVAVVPSRLMSSAIKRPNTSIKKRRSRKRKIQIKKGNHVK